MSFLTNLINGISLGSVYAIIALGYTMVYGIAKMLNFAHGDVIMVGGYICFCTTSYLGVPPIAGVLLAVVGCTALGIVVDCVATAKANGATLGEAVSVASKVAEETRILFIPAKGALPEDLHGLGRQGGLLAGMASLRRRIAGERRLLSIRRGELPVELFANVDPSDLTGRAVRTVSRASQEIGPVYYALVDARAGRLLHLLEKPLDTNEFEHRRLGIVSAGDATIASAGDGAIAIAYVSQAVYDLASTPHEI